MSFYEIESGQLRYIFAANGMLQGIFMPEEFGSVNLIRESSSLVLAYVDGREFSPAAGKIAPVRWKSRNGAEMFEFGNLPFTEDLKAWHAEKMNKRARFEDREVSFQMVIDDIYAVGAGKLVGRPKTDK